MASPRKTQWQLWRRFAENLVFTEAPKVVRALQQSPSLHQGLQRGLQLGFDLVVGGPAEPRPQIPAGRPVTDTSVPTAQRARRLSYGPDLTGRAQTGEVVWTWVVYADDPSRGQDRPEIGRASCRKECGARGAPNDEKEKGRRGRDEGARE